MRAVVIGGFVDYQIQMAKAFNRNDDALVYVYTKATSLPPENLRLADGVKVRLLSRPGALYHPVVFARFLKNSYRMVREIHGYRPDIVHLQIGSSMLAFYLPFLHRYPVVTTFHDLEPHKGEETPWEKYLHVYIRRASKYLLVHGDKLRETMISDYRQPPDKVKSIPIGPHNIDAFKAHASPDVAEPGNVVLFFGRVLEYKGLEYLIKAEPLIAREIPDVEIVIAGTGDDLKKYEALMVHQDRFTIINHYISYEEGARLFQRASVVALPYIEASQSGVVSTAYGFGKPVIATSVGSIPEVVDDGETGLIVPPRDPEALAKAIIALLKDEKLRKRMGENGLKKLSTDLSWDNVTRQTRRIYESALSGRQ